MFIESLMLGFESHFCCLIVVGPWTHWLSIAFFLSSSVSFISDIIKSRWSYYVTYSGFFRGIWKLSIALCIWNSVSYHIEGHLNWVLNFDVVYIAWHWYLYQDQISPQRKKTVVIITTSLLFIAAPNDLSMIDDMNITYSLWSQEPMLAVQTSKPF